MITIFGQHGCSACRTAKMLLQQKGIKHEYVIPVMPAPGVDYPQIYIDGVEIEYSAFLRGVQNGEIK